MMRIRRRSMVPAAWSAKGSLALLAFVTAAAATPACGGSAAGGGGAAAGGGAGGGVAVIAGCSMLPATHVFNPPIDLLPVDPQSASYLATIGDHDLHLDLGSSTDLAMVDSYYGIPYNV